MYALNPGQLLTSAWCTCMHKTHTYKLVCGRLRLWLAASQIINQSTRILPLAIKLYGYTICTHCFFLEVIYELVNEVSWIKLICCDNRIWFHMLSSEQLFHGFCYVMWIHDSCDLIGVHIKMKQDKKNAGSVLYFLPCKAVEVNKLQGEWITYLFVYNIQL